MINNRFETYKVRREIKRSGKEVAFYRMAKNEFGEPVLPETPMVMIKGIPHEHEAHMLNLFVDTQYTPGGTGRLGKSYMFLCLYEDIFFIYDGEETNIRYGDLYYINDKILRVVDVSNIMEWNMIADISFEELDDGDKGRF